MVAGPVLVAIDSSVLPGPLLVLATAVNIRNAILDSEHIDLLGWKRAVVAAPLGLLAGFLLLTALSDGSLTIAVSLFVIGAAGLQVFGYRPKDRPMAQYAAGATTAFSAVAAALPGPVFAVFYGHRDPATVRGTLSRFMLPISAAIIAILVTQDRFGTHELKLTAALAPGVLLGFPVGAFLRPRIAGPRFRVLVLGLATTSASVVLIRQLVTG